MDAVRDLGRMGPSMRQVVGIGDRSMGRSNLGGECRLPHCNQWGVCGIAQPVPKLLWAILLLFF